MKTVFIIAIVISTLVVVSGISIGVYYGTRTSDHSKRESKGNASTKKPSVTRCPVCKNGGNCDDGKCQCPPGFGGTDCSLRIPPLNPTQSHIPTPTPSLVPTPSHIPTPTPSLVPTPSHIPTPIPTSNAVFTCNVDCDGSGNWLGPGKTVEECTAECRSASKKFTVVANDGNCKCASDCSKGKDSPDWKTYYSNPVFKSNVDCNTSESDNWLGKGKTVEECMAACSSASQKFTVVANDGNCKCASASECSNTKDSPDYTDWKVYYSTPKGNGTCPSPVPSPSPVPVPKLCSPSCKNSAPCVDGTCQCRSNYTGDDCGTELCSPPCKNNGTCKDSKCVCPKGFTGTQCEYPQCFTHLDTSGYKYDTVNNCCTDIKLTSIPNDGDLVCTPELSKYGGKRFMCKVDINNSPWVWADDFKPADPNVDNKCGASCPSGRTGQGCNDIICHQGITNNDIYIYDEDNQCCTVSLQDKDKGSLTKGKKVCDVAKQNGNQIMYACVYQGDSAPKNVTLPQNTTDMLCKPSKTNSYFCPNSLDLSETKTWNGRCCESSKDAPSKGSIKSGDTVCVVATNKDVYGYRPCIYHDHQIADDLTVTSLGDTDYDCAMTSTADGGGSMPFCPPNVSLGDLYQKSSDKWTESGRYLATGCCLPQTIDEKNPPKSGDIVCIEEHGTKLYPCMYDSLSKPRMLHGVFKSNVDCNTSESDNWLGKGKTVEECMAACNSASKKFTVVANDGNCKCASESDCSNTKDSPDYTDWKVYYSNPNGNTGDTNYEDQTFDQKVDNTCNKDQSLGDHATSYPWCKTTDLRDARNLGCFCSNTDQITKPVVHQIAYEQDKNGTYLCEVSPKNGAKSETNKPVYIDPCPVTQHCVCTQNTGGWNGTYNSCRSMDCGNIPGYFAYCGECTNNGSKFHSHFPPC